MSEDMFDLIVIGAGPGGYVAAIRASQLGLKVAVVESRDTLGGVCLNEGCIPSKALLESSELFALARDRFGDHGIEIQPPKLDMEKMMARKDEVVQKLTDGVAFLFKKNKIKRFRGKGRLLETEDGAAGHQVRVEGEGKDEAQQIRGQKVLLATGSTATELPDLPFDDDLVVSAREALSFGLIPEHLLVVGAGFIGLELGSVWLRLGAKVTVVEMLPHILPHSDRKSADQILRSLKKQGMEFLLESKIVEIKEKHGRATATIEGKKGPKEVLCDRILVAVGRRPLTEGLGLDEVGVEQDERGRIKVDDDYQTNVPGIYAIGDLIPGPMLAHKASEEGVVFAERLAGQQSRIEYDEIPGVIYTWPEMASVGKTEEELKEAGIDYAVGKFPFSANGRARCLDETDGFVKVLAKPDSGKILGIHIVGPRASDLIAEATAVMAFGGSSRDIALMIHAHPTLSEAVKEAALAANGAAIHA
ncbi:dihydrolipoyl dehydrogenase [Desulfuromonas sp. AOP6]|uniref:dihydrolipoyl dehydrogenase n=1 Tax=Desulfuromonas sp. AOP6 TaxID=1566351 RepID=UPI001277FAE6|nr:dihydrolipoyl dehydrogenase [Desulfuromonas sp. AOP6]BCA78618.1 dihydrolipoyl dehydrogenase [Desulfuromonas sp. AOP6]